MNLAKIAVMSLPFLLQQFDDRPRSKDSTFLDLLGAVDLNSVVETLQTHQRNRQIEVSSIDITDSDDITHEVHEVKNIDQRIKKMISVMRLGAEKPKLRTLAASIVRGLRERDDMAEIKAIFDYVKSRVRYTNDISNVEAFSEADITLDWGIGDCDDFVILLGSLLISIGHEVTVRVIAEEDAWSHVYLLVSDPKPENRKGNQKPRQIALDASVNRPLGWEPHDEKPIAKTRDWKL